jgi:RNA polymerase sigma factor (TIGR02999 family)
MLAAMSDVTRILSAIEQGDPRAAEQLLPLVYDELRRLAAHQLAQELPGQTRQPTALVHEAYLRLLGGEPETPWNSRGHFVAAATEAMRRILVETARRKKTEKHGGKCQRIDLSHRRERVPCSNEMSRNLRTVYATVR